MTYQPHQSEDVTMKPVAGMNIDEAALKAERAHVDTEAVTEGGGTDYRVIVRIGKLKLHGLWTSNETRCEQEAATVRALLHRSQPVAVVPAEQAEDSAMLDWLDSMNRALNDFHGTKYGWKVVLSRHLTRVISERKSHGCIADIDVDDSHAHAPNSIRAAIRAAIGRNREAGGS